MLMSGDIAIAIAQCRLFSGYSDPCPSFIYSQPNQTWILEPTMWVNTPSRNDTIAERDCMLIKRE
jgi:hypothetical protein